MSATSDEYSEDEARESPAQKPQKLASRGKLAVLGSQTMDEIDGVLNASTYEDSPTGAGAAAAAKRALGRRRGANSPEVSNSFKEDDDVSFFSDPESSSDENKKAKGKAASPPAKRKGEKKAQFKEEDSRAKGRGGKKGEGKASEIAFERNQNDLHDLSLSVLAAVRSPRASSESSLGLSFSSDDPELLEGSPS